MPRVHVAGGEGSPDDLTGLAEAGVLLVTVPGAGHVVMVDEPGGFVAALAAARQ